ncbi:DNA replication and repair protein RecO [Gelidibacter algens]|jgi:DNA repair protein RecO (recombination protein O)|uniref:DNA repair protein RecO n=1 Tax=Gelidibacter algens TaxID=49280 RepID=A0A1A7R3K8_9FLAO|nr:DNA repair protein RecO [Gelidibacter algens]OBX26088.1 DNA repair protein RecO [Gelidibacter algens]RAJ22954.1 DNA replication and repair protein RecO [Gelidibacter algens]
MLVKTNAIVLSKIKYGDHDVIVKCYTKNRGVVSYLLRGILKSKRSNSKIAYYQPLSQLEIEENYKANHSLHFITDVKLSVPYHSMHTNILKGAIVMFLSEVLASTLKEEESNLSLYEFLETTLQWLDHETDFANFHLLFLLELSKHLGFYPDISQLNYPYFNLSTGSFELKPQTQYTISGENLMLLKQLLGIKFDELNTIKMGSQQRQSLLNSLLFYFELHLSDFKKPKSLQVLNQVFN